MKFNYPHLEGARRGRVGSIFVAAFLLSPAENLKRHFRRLMNLELLIELGAAVLDLR